MMGVLSIKELSVGRTAEADFDNGFSLTYTRHYQILTDGEVFLLDDLMLLGGQEGPGPDVIPRVGAAYKPGSAAEVQGYSVKVIEERVKYVVTVKYTTPTGRGYGQDPSTLDWEFTTDVIEHEWTPTTDLGDHPDLAAGTLRPIRNSAGERFVDGVAETEYWHVMNLHKFIKVWKMSDQFERQGMINADEVRVLGFTFPKHTLYCSRWTTSGKQVMEADKFYRLDVQLIYREAKIHKSLDVPAGKKIAGWIQALQNMGYNEQKDTGGGQRKLVKMPLLDGTPILGPLHGEGSGGGDPGAQDGSRLSDALVDAGNQVILQFRTKNQADMTGWGLPLSVPD